ncbi:DNA-binding protein [Peptacetobacter hominis]|uniref:DNA-binding protein n=1 Tax=Peptacetobacter hominis TaxID=2743610 RepID=A0A544QVW6_9FIRM|nr:S1-like domain-containing RNA-binding protein [Peptacetobacter hominis]TQQ84833.1 DNA-binding protein [Peptacetobacter hominis]
MVNTGKLNRLEVKRKTEFGYFLDGQTGNSSDDILLHNKFIKEGTEINIGDEIEVFIFIDSKGRKAATMDRPLAQVGDIAYLKVVSNTDIGSFVDAGFPKDILVPFKEKKFPLFLDEKYLFYIYLDKSGRIAATTDIDLYLSTDHEYKEGDTITGIVYGFQTNKTAMLCVDNKFAAVILNNEYYTELEIGQVMENLKVIKIYEDGKLGLTPRADRKTEMDSVEYRILSYMEGNDGYMRFNDKSDPNDIRILFNSSKKNFKRALGVLMKKGIVYQDENGTYLK